MGLWKRFFGSKPAPVEDRFEVVETNLDLELHKYQVLAKRSGREFYIEELFQNAVKSKELQSGRFFQVRQDPHNAEEPFKDAVISKELQCSRFFLVREDPPKPHFAPSLDKALKWFRGRDLPKDGYNSIFWGDDARYQCNFCHRQKQESLRITVVEKMAIFINFPVYMEVVGWRVVEAATDLMGPGIPTKVMDLYKTVPVVKWFNNKKKFICASCVRRLQEVGRETELAEYAIFS